MSIQTSATAEDRRRRRALQLLFIFANLALVEVRVPGVPWVIVGAVFWIAMIVLAAVGGSWMCGWVCWIGGIQDLMEPLARSRIRINPRWGQGITLTLLVVWVPLFWWLFPDASSAVYTPFGINFDGWPRHVFQVGLMLLAGLSVFFLGKRGICRYLCPFNSVVGVARRLLPKRKHVQGIQSIDGIPASSNVVSAESAGCAAGCANCAAGCHSHAIASVGIQFTPDLTIPISEPLNHSLSVNHVKREVS